MLIYGNWNVAPYTHLRKKFSVTSTLYIALKSERRKVVTPYIFNTSWKCDWNSMKIHKIIPISIGCPEKPHFAFTTPIWIYGW